jgi:carbon-monoxide dehydrogenase medium subunit
MRLPSPFNYYRAKTEAEALSLLGELQDKAVLIAGGTDFLSARCAQRIENLVDISGIKELSYIRNETGTVKIGALTTHSQVSTSDVTKKEAFVLADAETAIGTVEIRNRGTIGGNICNASPCADTVPPLMVLDSRVKISSKKGERVVPIDQFFVGPGKTILEPHELLTEIQIPLNVEGNSCFMKLGRRNAFNLSVVCVAAFVAVEDGRFSTVRIALGSVAPTPIRAKKAERFLVGKELSRDCIDEAADIVKDDIKPITDVRGTVEYRTEMSKAFTRRVLVKAVQQTAGGPVGGEI